MPDQPVARQQPLRGEIVFGRRPGTEPPAVVLDWISFVMDRLVAVPGTRLRVGLNTLFMLLPILGDVIPTLVSLGILAVGLSNYRVPRIVAARMVLNSLLDASLGWIPLIGDLFDLFFKADTRNVRLLQEYAGRGDHPPRGTWRHWAAVLGVVGLFALVLALVVLGALWVIEGLIRAIRGH